MWMCRGSSLALPPARQCSRTHARLRIPLGPLPAPSRPHAHPYLLPVAGRWSQDPPALQYLCEHHVPTDAPGDWQGSHAVH